MLCSGPPRATLSLAKADEGVGHRPVGLPNRRLPAHSLRSTSAEFLLPKAMQLLTACSISSFLAVLQT
jgi:hypothetical protein